MTVCPTSACAVHAASAKPWAALWKPPIAPSAAAAWVAAASWAAALSPALDSAPSPRCSALSRSPSVAAAALDSAPACSSCVCAERSKPSIAARVSAPQPSTPVMAPADASLSTCSTWAMASLRAPWGACPIPLSWAAASWAAPRRASAPSPTLDATPAETWAESPSSCALSAWPWA